MDKLTMAHDWAMKYGKVDSNYNRENTVQLAWDYADAMQAEADKREKEKQDKAKQEQQNYEVAIDSIGVEQWQPDWSQAPDNMTYFAVDENGSGWFFNRKPHTESDCCWYCGDDSTELDNHNYQGDWQKSLRKRP